MKNYENIFFDLDGTLSDSALGIINATCYSLNKMGIDPGDKEKLKKFIGPPLAESFAAHCDFSESETKEAINHFREYYETKGILENTMYEGIEDLLIALCDCGKNLVVATSKPEPFAKIILERYGIDKYFSFIAGSTIDETRTKKDEVIAYALENCEISDKNSIIMIGDRSHDVLGALKNGIDCVGVLYGYGTREELEGAGAISIATDVSELLSLLVKK